MEYLNLINLARVRQIKTLEQLDLNEHLGKVERNKKGHGGMMTIIIKKDKNKKK